jgi:hypothetical protein
MNRGTGPVRRVWTSGLLGAALALGAVVYLVAYPPALGGADESYILYEAKRLWNGDVPYRDFFDFIMPGTFYFYALAYAVVFLLLSPSGGLANGRRVHFIERDPKILDFWGERPGERVATLLVAPEHAGR